MSQAPPRAEDLLLTLTNDGTSYARIFPKVQAVIANQGKAHAMRNAVADLRRVVYGEAARQCRLAHDAPYMASDHLTTSWLVVQLIQKYHEEATRSTEPPSPRFWAAFFAGVADSPYHRDFKALFPELHTAATQSDVAPTTSSNQEIDTMNDTVKPNLFDADKQAVETKTFVFGREVSTITQADIFNHIARLENEIAALDKITTKPKALVAQIEAKRADIAKLVELSDQLHDKAA